MKQIPLTGKYGIGKFALVDDEDYDTLSKFTWQLDRTTTGRLYARRYKPEKYRRSSEKFEQFMHRVILNPDNAKVLVDHIDHDPLNNQRSNLRLCSTSENCYNRMPHSGGKSIFKGVCPIHVNGSSYWRSVICKNNKITFLGNFPYTPCGEVLAAVRYDIAAVILHGDFAYLNFKPLWPTI